MKILLTTIVDNTNIGTYLQALATIRSLEKLGHSVTILNYTRKYILGPEYAWKRWKNKFLPFRILYIIAYVYIVNKNVKRVRRFLLERVCSTQKVNSIKQVVKYSKGYDLYLTGSDQVWNCGHNGCFDPVFYNGFTSGLKASYAASIGMEHIPEEYIECTKKYLSQYKYISVRESSAICALNEIGIENIHEVLDPTLLLDREEWGKTLPKFEYKGNPYLLIYSVEEEKEQIVYNMAKKMATQLNLKTVYLTTSKSYKNSWGYDTIIENASPIDFLYYFLNASFAVVSSFHGTAFSINFNVPFVTVLPNRYNTRAESLLRHYGIENRMVREEDYAKELSPIDFTSVNKILKLDRFKSMEYLKLITK